MNAVDQYRGCLLGLAVGDALGAPLEFLHRSTILERYSGEVADMVGGGWLNVLPGEYTDDTQMALCIAESLVEKEDFDALDIARRFVAWYAKGPKDVGNTTARALAYLESHPNEWNGGLVTADSNSAGNGGLMRCAPVALLFAGREPELIRASATSSQITHGEQRAVDSCVALNLAIDLYLTDGDTDWESRLLSRLKESVRNEEVRQVVANLATKAYAELEPSGFCLDSLECALWCVVKSDGLEEAVIRAINLGGDADTIGAITGALAGARWGEEQIPMRWLAKLQDRDHIAILGTTLYSINQRRR
jgi:ADP-ribosyl-[dinitrogen reductase] hydrolase